MHKSFSFFIFFAEVSDCWKEGADRQCEVFRGLLKVFPRFSTRFSSDPGKVLELGKHQKMNPKRDALSPQVTLSPAHESCNVQETAEKVLCCPTQSSA